jgi:hypothetical protein
MQRLPLIQGDRNTTAISAGVSTLALQVTHNAGADFIIEGFSIIYNGTIDEVLIRLYDSQHNRDLITPNTEICTVGDRRGVSQILPFIKLKDPIVLRSGQSIQMYVNNTTAGSIAAKDLGLTLYGYQVLQ